MNPNDKIEVLKRLSALAETFMGKEKPSSFQLDMYLDCFEGYELLDISKACTHVFKTFKSFGRMPEPSLFIEFLEGNEQEQALNVWQHVIKEISRKGVDNAKFDESTTRAINSVGGIRAIGHCDIEKISFKEKDFINNYKVAVKSKGFKQIENKKLNKLTDSIG